MDWSLLHTLNAFFLRHDGIEDPTLAYVNAAEIVFAGMLVLVTLVAHGTRLASWRRAAVAGGLSAALGLAIAHLLSTVVYRARPFAADPGKVHLFARHAADASFPSDHATAAFAIGMAIVLRRRGWGVVVLAAAAVLAVGRVALGLHYPSDVLGGALIGVAAAWVLWMKPLRVRVDALADFTGGLWDRAIERLVSRIRARRLA